MSAHPEISGSLSAQIAVDVARGDVGRVGRWALDAYARYLMDPTVDNRENARVAYVGAHDRLTLLHQRRIDADSSVLTNEGESFVPDEVMVHRMTELGIITLDLIQRGPSPSQLISGLTH